MRVRMKVSVSGARNGKAWPAPGGIIDLPDHEAAAMCAAGLAEQVPDAPPAPAPATAPVPPVETAVDATPSETTTEPKPRRRARTRTAKDAHSQG